MTNTNNTFHLYMKDSEILGDMAEAVSHSGLLTSEQSEHKYASSDTAGELLSMIGIEHGEDFRPSVTFNDDKSVSFKLGNFTIDIPTEMVSYAIATGRRKRLEFEAKRAAEEAAYAAKKQKKMKKG